MRAKSLIKYRKQDTVYKSPIKLCYNSNYELEFYSYSLSPTLGVKLRGKRRVRVEFTLLVKTSREKLHFKSTFKLNLFDLTLQLVIRLSFVSLVNAMKKSIFYQNMILELNNFRSHF